MLGLPEAPGCEAYSNLSPAASRKPSAKIVNTILTGYVGVLWE